MRTVRQRPAGASGLRRVDTRLVAAIAALLALVAASSSAASSSFGAGRLRPPANKSLPKVSGTAAVGQTLTASSGSWSNTPTGFSYRWQRCTANGSSCSDADGTTPTYPLTNADVGSTLRVVVSATNAAGSTSATSRVTAAVAAAESSSSAPTNATPPSVSGATVEAQTLTASTGTWANSPTGYRYQWRACDSSGANCIDVSGATSASYLLTSAEVGKTMRAVVTATNTAGSASASSQLTAAVTARSTASDCTLYAAPGGSPSNPGTSLSAPLTLGSAASKVVPGSVVCLEAGTYVLNSPIYLNRAGTPTAYIVFRNDGGKALLTSNFSSPDEIIQVMSTAAYIEINGLAFDGKGTNANLGIHIKDHSHHIRVVKNIITNMGAGGILASNADYVTCVGNEIHRFGDGVGWASGISLNQDAGPWWFDTAPGFHDVVADNVVSGGVDNSSWHSDGNGIILDLGGAIAPALITGNVVYMNGGRGIESFKTSGSVYVVNNTLYKNGLDLREPGIGELVANAAANQTWANNVVVAWSPRYSYQLIGGASVVTFQRNVRNGGLGTQNVPSTVLSDPLLLKDSDPLFVASPVVDASADGQWRTSPSPWSLGNGLALRDASPLVNAALDPRSLPGLNAAMLEGIKSYAMHAVDGTSRPVGGGFDYGAYER